LKPVILLYDLDNKLVDECAALLGKTGLYTTISTYNEANAQEAIRQYNRYLGLGTNKIACLITGWNSYKKPRDQFLFALRAQERRSPFRHPTPVVLITEDHRRDLRQIALDPTDGDVSAYLHSENFAETIEELLQKIVFGDRAHELNSIAFAQFQREEEE
jgi:hypothetical protein